MSRPLIIERPGLQSRLQKYGQISIAVVMWVLWLWLWLPVLTLILWALGINLVFTEFIIDEDWLEVLFTLFNFFNSVLFIVGVQYLWSLYNLLRFRNKVRRRDTKPLSVEEVAEDNGYSIEFVKSAQMAEVLNLSHDELGNIQSGTTAR